MTLVEIVRARITAGKPVRRSLPGGGRLHVDRALPFLCVYRPPARPDLGTAELVRTQASYLIGGDAALLDGVVDAVVEVCGACLVLELWAGDEGSTAFRIHAAEEDRLATTIEALAGALRKLAGAVEVVTDARPSATRAGVLAIGLEVPPVYRNATSVYPLMLRGFARDVMHALQLGFFEFTRVQTRARPEHFQMMGRRRLVHAVRDSDQALAEISTSFDFLLSITPINVEAAWAEFCKGGRATAPVLHYRMLEIDPEQGKRQLYDLPLERLEDPVLAQLLRDKRRELDRQLAMLEDRDTPRFLLGSLQLYPAVDDALLGEALGILEAARPGVAAPGERCGAAAFARRAEREVAHYRERAPALTSKVEIREDVAALTVSHGDLLVPHTLDVAAHRTDALLQHEVGTHVVTFANGAAQPLRVLAAGLAGYEALQEGLAMLAEHLAGGLDAERLRLIAARVIAVRRLVDGVTFPALVAELVDQHRLPARVAFGVAVRVFRGGGLTKDAIYLRGLLQVLEHLRSGGALDPLLVGKVAFEQIALIEELVWREVLRPPLLTPRWLDAPAAAPKLARARRGLRPLDLVEAA